MRLTRLIVRRFGSVRHAHVEFGPGLNVLYGPNDLGKSTLAQAIRAALLLPPGSSAHEEFVEWGTDETPRVELVFQAERGGRFYRIRKDFGSGSSARATLHGSADGQTWTQEAKGRKVDGEVRRLLSWGIAEPGGRGGTRGLPQSFLTAVLLAKQTDPAGIFDASIDADADESGKKLLTHALQALSQDPLLKRALDAAQMRIDEAYTSTGRRKTGRGSPFKAAADAIQSAIREHEDRLSDLNRTREVESGIEGMNEERLQAEEHRDQAGAVLRELEATARRQETRRALTARLQEAHEAVAQIEAAHRRVADGVADQERLSAELVQAGAGVTEAEARRAAIETRLTDARDALARVHSGDAARERELERKTVEKELLEVEASLTAAGDVARRAQAVGDADRAVEEAREAGEALDARVQELRGKVKELEERKEQAEHLREQLAGLVVYESWQRAREEAREGREAKGEARKLRAQVTRLRKRAGTDDGEERTLPTPEELKKLRKLNQQCAEAQARLGGGLSAVVRVKRPLNIKASLDGGPEKLHRAVKQRRSFDADTAMTLDLGGIAEIELSAGEADAREKAEKLRGRWEKVGAPALKAAGVRSLSKLEDACLAAEAARRETGEAERQIQDLERRAEALDGLGSRADELDARAKTREQSLKAYDRDALELLAEKLGPDRDADVERLRGGAADEASRANAERDAATRQLAGLEAEYKSRTERLAEAESRHEAALAELSDGATLADPEGPKESNDPPWEAALRGAREAVSTLEARRADARRRLEALTTDGGDAVGNAGRTVETLQAELAEAQASVRTAVQARDAALRAVSDAQGELRVRRERAEALDLEGARAAAEQLTAELAATHPPESEESEEPEVSEAELDAARERLERAEQVVGDRKRELQMLLGALQHVGGDVAHERERMAAEAVERAREREAALDLDYGAWRLLHETLREVESEESVHLGRALVEPISKRFAQLTDGRYGAIDVEPGLKTRGIQAGGDTRGVETLSAGLRDQLATLFRLSVAEHLESLLVLDDQLAQTDPARVDWFGQVLRECSERIQIVLLTCRPGEILGDDEMAPPGDATRDSDSGTLRAVDLSRIVERAPLDSR